MLFVLFRAVYFGRIRFCSRGLHNFKYSHCPSVQNDPSWCMFTCTWQVHGSSYETVNQTSFYQTLAEVCVCKVWSTRIRRGAWKCSRFSCAHVMVAHPARLQNHPEVGMNAHLCGPGGKPRVLNVEINATVTHTVVCVCVLNWYSFVPRHAH